MEKAIVYDELQNQIPKGDFYTLGSIPYKSTSYKIQFDTMETGKRIYVDVNSTLYTFYTDSSGILEVNLNLMIGENKIRFRYEGETLWREFIITTTNLATLHSGVADTLSSMLDNEYAVWLKNSLLNTDNYSPFESLLGVDLANKYKLEEVSQSLFYWGSMLKGLRQIGAAIENIPISLRKIGNFIPDRNLISNFYTEDGIISTYICTETDDIGMQNVLYTGQSATVYINLQHKENQYGFWVFDSWIRPSTSAQIIISLSIDGVNWISSNTLSLNADVYAQAEVYVNGLAPKYAKVDILLPSSADVYIAESRIAKDTWRQTFPYSISEWMSRRSIALLSYGN